MEKLTDSSLMPFGVHKGKKIANVPAEYLLWLYDNNKATYPIRKYIEENIDVLRNETWKHK